MATRKKIEAAQSDAASKAVDAIKTHLRVRAKVAGFRRCGRAWPGENVVVAKSAFTADQVARLLADPDLIAEEVAA